MQEQFDGIMELVYDALWTAGIIAAGWAAQEGKWWLVAAFCLVSVIHFARLYLTLGRQSTPLGDAYRQVEATLDEGGG